MGNGREAGDKFAKRRNAVIDTASLILNRDGANAFRLGDVADRLGLDISSLNYYFRKKEGLIAACLERSVLWLEDAVIAAATERDPIARADALIASHFEMFASQRRGETTLALLSDIPSLVDEARKPLEAHVDQAMRTLGGFFAPSTPDGSRSRQLVCANILASNLFWLPAWQYNFDERDFARVRAAMIDLFANGLLTGDIAPGQIDRLDAASDDAARDAYLEAATRLINRHGHKGAKVERVAAELGLSTGSFYHHLRTKNELVTACFERSFAVFDRAIELAAQEATGAAAIARLTRSVAHHQLTARAPLLRIGSYQALAPELRQEMFLRSVRLTNRIAGLIARGSADGSMRHCDTGLGAQHYLAAVYGFADLRDWSAPEHAERLTGHFVNVLLKGAA